MTKPILNHEILGISRAQHNALLWVAEQLEDPTSLVAQHLDMDEWIGDAPVRGCHTVACIGGWVDIHTKVDPDQSIGHTAYLLEHSQGSESRRGLSALLFDFHHLEDYNNPLVQAQRIRRYLTTEYPD